MPGTVDASVRGLLFFAALNVAPGASIALHQQKIGVLSATSRHGFSPARAIEMEFQTDFGATRVSFAVPPATRVDDRTVSYATSVNNEPLRLTVTTAVCVDTMSGMPRPEQVLLTLGDLRLQGCGGNPAALLQGREWTVATLAGTPSLAAARIKFTFGDDGRLSGLASCNRFGADYSLTGEGLSVGKGMSSMMACEPDVMKQEQLFMELLERVSQFSIDDNGALILHSDRDRTIVTERP